MQLVYLKGDMNLIGKRLRGRKGHFMPASLLASQFATLEPPGPDETVITVSAEPPLDAVVAAILAALPTAVPD